MLIVSILHLTKFLSPYPFAAADDELKLLGVYGCSSKYKHTEWTRTCMRRSCLRYGSGGVGVDSTELGMCGSSSLFSTEGSSSSINP